MKDTCECLSIYKYVYKVMCPGSLIAVVRKASQLMFAITLYV